MADVREYQLKDAASASQVKRLRGIGTNNESVNVTPEVLGGLQGNPIVTKPYTGSPFDLNNCTENGLYYVVRDCTHTPSGMQSNGILIVERNHIFVMQTIYDFKNLFIRMKTSTDWSTEKSVWKKVTVTQI